MVTHVLSDPPGGVKVMITVWQHLGLHDRHKTILHIASSATALKPCKQLHGVSKMCPSVFLHSSLKKVITTLSHSERRNAGSVGRNTGLQLILAKSIHVFRKCIRQAAALIQTSIKVLGVQAFASAPVLPQ